MAQKNHTGTTAIKHRYSCNETYKNQPPTKIALKELLRSFLHYPISHDKSIEEVCNFSCIYFIIIDIRNEEKSS
jgi:hypothetical protein